MRIAVYGLWHLGSVTAACLASAGHQVVGLDPDPQVVGRLGQGQPPLYEPGLSELISAGLQAGRLTFSTEPASALADAELFWVAFDTPVNEQDEADVAQVREYLEDIADCIRPGTVVLISSQVPVGFTRSLEHDWRGRGLQYAYSPENLRLGKALDSFRKPERVIIGIRDDEKREMLTALFTPFCSRIEWMSIESAEMTKHALNAFLAASVTFINELARLCEVVGADAKEVERGLKSESRIGSHAYLAPGAAFAGGTLARDVRFLSSFGRQYQVGTPLFNGVLASNDAHKNWIQDKVTQLLAPKERATVAILGLTYKPGTSTLRRSAAVELCTWLHQHGIHVQAHDPAVAELPGDLQSAISLCRSPREALTGAALAVVATEWPEYRSLPVEQFLEVMAQPRIIDPNWFLAETLARDDRIVYVATGKPISRQAA